MSTDCSREQCSIADYRSKTELWQSCEEWPPRSIKAPVILLQYLSNLSDPKTELVDVNFCG